MYDLEKPINEAVFPGLQGGPHNHSMAGVGVGLLQVTNQMTLIRIISIIYQSEASHKNNFYL